MKKLNLLYAAAMLLSIVSCQQSELFEDNAPAQGTMREITVQATMNDGGSDTRASMTPTDPVGTNHDDFTELTWVSEWQAHDKLGAWSSGATTFSEFTIDPISYKTGDENDNKTASFTGEVTAGATTAYFFYPYDEGATITDDKYTVDISTQLCDGGAVFHHYGKSKPMVSEAISLSTATIPSIKLHNLSAGMEYRLYFTGATSGQNDIRVVRLELSGDAIKNSGELDFSTGTFTQSTTAGTIRIDVDNSPKLNDYNVNTELYSLIGSIFPFLLPKGEKVTLTVYTNYGKYSKDFTATEGDMDFALGQHHYITMEVPMGSLSSYDDFVGRGTAAYPYQVKTRADMARIATNVNAGTTTYEGKHFKMMNDIDLGGRSNQWTVIGTFNSREDNKPFKGTFDGNGKKFTGLYIDKPNNDTQGLFGYLDGATIKNLGVDGEVIGKDYVGSIVGYAENSTINNSYNKGTVKGYTYIGGIAGYLVSSSNSNNCYNAGTVTGNTYIGGIAGNIAESSNNNNCYNTGTVTGIKNTGGIVGVAVDNSSNNNCYNAGTVTGNTYTGGIAGVAVDNSSNNNCYYLANETGVEASGITPMSETDMKAPSFLTTLNTNAAKITGACAWTTGPDGYPTLDFGKTPQASSTINENWIDTAAPNFGGGQGTQKNPYIISTPMELAKLAKDVNAGTTYKNKHFALACDIDLSAKQWTPIGAYKSDTDFKAFEGTFNGNRKNIQGLYINSTAQSWGQGLFAYLGQGGVIKNMNVSGTIDSNSNTGGIVSFSKGSIQGCSFIGSISCSGGTLAAGIVGDSRGTITSCWNASTISINSNAARIYAGGIAGYSTDNINSCYNLGRVTASEAANLYVGGILGYRGGGYVKYCYTRKATDGGTEAAVGFTEYASYLSCLATLSDEQMRGAVFQYTNESSNSNIVTELRKGDNAYWQYRTGDYPWLGF